MRISGVLLFFVWLCLGSPATLHAQRNAHELKPVPMRLPPPDPDAPRWHSITVHPKPNLPKIHFYDKLNPIWWLGNADDPTPPDWYKADDTHRKTKWYFRNPFHNFTHYVIGVADKKFTRSGKFPERNSDPRGGWNMAVSRRYVLPLPYISYERSRCTFYFGWRERGNFGMKLNVSNSKKTATSAGKKSGNESPGTPAPKPQ